MFLQQQLQDQRTQHAEQLLTYHLKLPVTFTQNLTYRSLSTGLQRKEQQLGGQHLTQQLLVQQQQHAEQHLTYLLPNQEQQATSTQYQAYRSLNTELQHKELQLQQEERHPTLLHLVPQQQHAGQHLTYLQPNLEQQATNTPNQTYHSQKSEQHQDPQQQQQHAEQPLTRAHPQHTSHL
jgi:hypothetical protein